MSSPASNTRQSSPRIAAAKKKKAAAAAAAPASPIVAAKKRAPKSSTAKRGRGGRPPLDPSLSSRKVLVSQSSSRKLVPSLPKHENGFSKKQCKAVTAYWGNPNRKKGQKTLSIQGEQVNKLQQTEPSPVPFMGLEKDESILVNHRMVVPNEIAEAILPKLAAERLTSTLGDGSISISSTDIDMIAKALVRSVKEKYCVGKIYMKAFDFGGYIRDRLAGNDSNNNKLSTTKEECANNQLAILCKTIGTFCESQRETNQAQRETNQAQREMNQAQREMNNKFASGIASNTHGLSTLNSTVEKMGTDLEELRNVVFSTPVKDRKASFNRFQDHDGSISDVIDESDDDVDFYEWDEEIGIGEEVIEEEVIDDGAPLLPAKRSLFSDNSELSTGLKTTGLDEDGDVIDSKLSSDKPAAKKQKTDGGASSTSPQFRPGYTSTSTLPSSSSKPDS